MRHRIYIPLADQPGTFRASEAKPVGNGQFSVAGPVAAGERWQFMPGEIVECESRTLPDGSKGLVAVSSVSPDPEASARRTVFGWCGALVGALLGLGSAIGLGIGGVPIFLVGVFCAIVFAWCSMRWGDDAWDVLSKLLG
jgi:hypothetical protein